MKNNKGFVVSAVLYPLLVLFLALIMGLLAMTDTRKRILDKMKLEISDSIFDEATCSCDTILNKLNYIIKNGVAGGGGGGSYTYNVLGVNVKAYDSPASMPNVGNGIGDIAVITDVEIDSYYVSRTAPGSPKEGTVWIVQDKTSNYHITSDYSNIGISYVMQYINGKWELKKSYVYDNARWTLLYYVPLKNGIVDLNGTDLNAEIEKTYSYTGNYQTFTARFSGYYQVELWGAEGGCANTTYGKGGKGAYTSGEIYLNAGEILYVYVGGTTSSILGGWNGGGNGNNGSYTARGGGGSTDIRLVSTSGKDIWNEFDSLKSRIMVAAGGGGGDFYSSQFTSHGGSGGVLTGSPGTSSWQNFYGTGATQSSGGYLNSSNHYSLVGSFGSGATSGSHGNGSGGGGSGYYGGGGANGLAGGGGGSSYISGHEGCSSIEEESTSENIIHNGNSYHYSGYYFNNTTMMSGTNIEMPNYDGTGIMSGNSGNGYAKFRLKSVQVKSDEEIKNSVNNKLKYSYYYSASKTAGRYQTFIAPKTGTYNVELWGARGGSHNQPGGKGAYTSGEIFLEKNSELYVYVGEKPDNGVTGGWNGGGDGYTSGENIGRGGGGATDLRYIRTTGLETWNQFDSLKSRIMIAAGGGGSDYYDGFVSAGGAGGGLNGINGTGSWQSSYGTGGTQSAGGYMFINEATLFGNFGSGSPGGAHGNGSGGGGGGYYGGGGGDGIGGGGGGSSYISGHNGCSSIEEESMAENIIHNGSRYHYSTYYFGNTVMKSDVNDSHGYAIIQLVSESNKVVARDDKIKQYYYSGNGLLSGRYQVFDTDVAGTYRIELWGAKGGMYSQQSGNGAYTSGEIYLPKGTRLYLYVGSNPGTHLISSGWNGGGNGYTNGSYIGRGGGGSTDIRTIKTSVLTAWNEEASLKSRVMVAAAGGGSSFYSGFTSIGGAGGGLNGINGTGSWQNSYGTGATQTKGGYLNTNSSLYNGSFGYASPGGAHGNSSGGGGSGWYGGGGGNGIGGGGGGSSYISGHAGCIAVDSSGKPKVQTYTTLNDSISYTGYKFTNTQMIDGNGYPWTTVKQSISSGMPSPIDSTIISGNTGSGYAKITYLGA